MRLGLAALMLLGGCASSQLVVLPGEEGAGTGAVAVLDPESEADVGVVDRANQRAGVSGARRVNPRAISDEKVGRKFGGLLATMPPKPRSFDLQFRFESTDLTVESEAMLPGLFDEVRKRAGADVQIVGHTDTMGDAAANQTLSVERANMVARLLEAKGLDANVVSVAGRGEAEALERTGDEQPSPVDRRVQVVVR